MQLRRSTVRYQLPGKETQTAYVDGFVLPVPKSKDETVVFAWIVFKSRADRDRIPA